ncbi:MAG: indole-3-glycerol phosphate synthase TrpC [Thermodesulfobacteriota bacterium]
MILDTIVQEKKKEVGRLLRDGFAAPDREIPPPRGFARALLADAPVAVIAEIKKASPSKGLICADFDPVAIATSYREGGASAISVLTDESFFQGSLQYVPQVRAAVDLPVLRKDFLIHEIQVRQARAFGADAILLIAAILSVSQIRELAAQAEEAGMDVLTEVHDEAELEKCLAAGCRLIGINNRNLQTFQVDLETTFRLNRMIPAAVPVVSESGIGSPAETARLRDAGIAAVLVGESLMRSPDRAAALRRLRACGG